MPRSGLVPLRVVVCLALALFAGLSWWTWASTREDTSDGRTPIVFWGSAGLGEDVWSVIHHFEELNPSYRVIMGTAVARDLTGDAQRLLSAIAGGVPPDLVWFDRFAVGEWAGKGALEDLTPWFERQSPEDPNRIELKDYYPFAVDEGSYAKPGSGEPKRMFALPMSWDIRVLYSNADLLRQEGLVDEHGEPQPPRTWEELRDYTKRLTRFKIADDPASGLERCGFAPNYGNSWLYMYAWQAGGELLSPDRTRVTLDSPPVVRALRYMTDVYDDIGGIAKVEAFQSGLQGDALDPFLRGQIAMKIDGNWCLDNLMAWRPDMDFIVSPAPIPADELAKGRTPITWAGGWALVVPATSRHKDGAFKLMQFLNTWDSVDRLARSTQERQESEGKMYLPYGHPNRVFYQRLVERTINANPKLPKRLKEAIAVLQKLLPDALVRPVSPVGQLLWNQHRRAYESAVHHGFAAAAKDSGGDEIAMALTSAQKDVQHQLDRVLAPPPPTLVDWRPWLWLYALLLCVPFLIGWLAYRRHRRRFGWRAREVGAAMLFASPWMIGFAVFVGGPILFSILISFAQYDVLTPARWVGAANYRAVAEDDIGHVSLANTAYMLMRIPMTMVVSLAIALLVNRSMRGIGTYRTLFYLPAVMPMVATSLLWMMLLNGSNGAINQFLSWLFATPPAHALEALCGWISGHSVHFSPPGWLTDKAWAKPSLILMSLWSAGGGMIIWLAGLQAIPQQLYEAASIDGASAWQRFRHITVPMLSPYILFNLIVGVIGTLQIFSEAYIMTAGGPDDATLFYAYHLFNQAFQYFRMGYASALAWILFVVVLALTLVQLWFSKKWVTYDHV
ncbi:MAG: extracellular solute-binding protein [Planctomycetes bacterium]|nr:extracellular solute-binding protein [Planctomycetota bacterium]